MNITKQADGNKLILFLDGKLDTVTAPQLDAELKAAFEEYDTVEINMEKLVYISSAGLRVLLSAQKKAKGSMKLTNVCELVMEVFEITGFVDILEIFLLKQLYLYIHNISLLALVQEILSLVYLYSN